MPAQICKKHSPWTQRIKKKKKKNQTEGDEVGLEEDPSSEKGSLIQARTSSRKKSGTFQKGKEGVLRRGKSWVRKRLGAKGGERRKKEAAEKLEDWQSRGGDGAQREVSRDKTNKRRKRKKDTRDTKRSS